MNEVLTLSVVIPAHNEEDSIEGTVRGLIDQFQKDQIPYEILVINDHSSDSTEDILSDLSSQYKRVRYLNNPSVGGFGFAIRYGLARFEGDVVAIVMADASDLPKDVSRFYKILLEENVECIFGTRFSSESIITDYPLHKLFLNRLANWFIKTIFNLKYNDITNAFKMYRREVIQGIQPILSQHFNLTVELPLKAIIRGYRYKIVPNDWMNRQHGISKLKIKEMGSRYLFIVIYCFVEKWLSRGDYVRTDELNKKKGEEMRAEH